MIRKWLNRLALKVELDREIIHLCMVNGKSFEETREEAMQAAIKHCKEEQHKILHPRPVSSNPLLNRPINPDLDIKWY